MNIAVSKIHESKCIYVVSFFCYTVTIVRLDLVLKDENSLKIKQKLWNHTHGSHNKLNTHTPITRLEARRPDPHISSIWEFIICTYVYVPLINMHLYPKHTFSRTRQKQKRNNNNAFIRIFIVSLRDLCTYKYHISCSFVVHMYVCVR